MNKVLMVRGQQNDQYACCGFFSNLQVAKRNKLDFSHENQNFDIRVQIGHT